MQLIFRAIDIQALIGTIGGYIGLFLGYSILQIPNTLTLLIKRAIKWYSEKTTRSKNMVDIHPSVDTIERIESGNLRDIMEYIDISIERKFTTLKTNRRNDFETSESINLENK